MPVVDAHRARISYEVQGDGFPLVFVHGGDGNSLIWFQQIPYFASRYRTLVINLRSFLNSPCALEDYHARHFPDDLLAVLDAEGVERAAIACHSLGAWAGLPLAVRHPQRVACLAINGSPTPAYSPQNWAVLERAIGFAIELHKRRLTDLTQMGFAPDFELRRPDLAYLYFRINALNGPRDIRTMMDDAVKLHPRDFRGYRTPTLVMGGVHDVFLAPQSHEHVASLIPGVERHTFLNSGHSNFYEEPGNYNRVLDAFLQKHTGVGSA